MLRLSYYGRVKQILTMIPACFGGQKLVGRRPVSAKSPRLLIRTRRFGQPMLAHTE